MKIINFSVVEKLPSLLDKSCSQTIRPAWEEWHIIPNYHRDRNIPLKCNCKEKQKEKPPRFKVGDECQIMWEQGSRYKWFCGKCGSSATPGKEKKDWAHPKSWMEQFSHCNSKNCDGLDMPVFNKHFGNVKITSVFKIEMDKGECFQETGIHCVEGWTGTQCIDLAKKDGFKSVENMVEAIDKLYDLSQAKEFYVYKWKWIRNGVENNV